MNRPFTPHMNAHTNRRTAPFNVPAQLWAWGLEHCRCDVLLIRENGYLILEFPEFGAKSSCSRSLLDNSWPFVTFSFLSASCLICYPLDLGQILLLGYAYICSSYFVYCCSFDGMFESHIRNICTAARLTIISSSPASPRTHTYTQSISICSLCIVCNVAKLIQTQCWWWQQRPINRCTSLPYTEQNVSWS